MTNADFLKKASKDMIATFFCERTLCYGCFISNYCAKRLQVTGLSCREMFRAWLEEEATE